MDYGGSPRPWSTVDPAIRAARAVRYQNGPMNARRRFNRMTRVGMAQLNRLRKRGSQVYCPCCETWQRDFRALVMPDRQCWVCGSLERHRLLSFLFDIRPELLRPSMSILHVAPEPQVAPRVRRAALRYVSGDLNANSAPSASTCSICRSPIASSTPSSATTCSSTSLMTSRRSGRSTACCAREHGQFYSCQTSQACGRSRHRTLPIRTRCSVSTGSATTFGVTAGTISIACATPVSSLRSCAFSRFSAPRRSAHAGC